MKPLRMFMDKSQSEAGPHVRPLLPSPVETARTVVDHVSGRVAPASCVRRHDGVQCRG